METKAEKIWVAKAERRKKRKRRRETKRERRKKKKESKIIDIKKVAKEWEIWNEKEEAARLEEEAKKLVPE